MNAAVWMLCSTDSNDFGNLIFFSFVVLLLFTFMLALHKHNRYVAPRTNRISRTPLDVRRITEAFSNIVIMKSRVIFDEKGSRKKRVSVATGQGSKWRTLDTDLFLRHDVDDDITRWHAIVNRCHRKNHDLFRLEIRHGFFFVIILICSIFIVSFSQTKNYLH